MAEMIITISFKKSERGLYEEVCKHSSRGGFIKDALKQYMDGNIVSMQNSQEKKENIDVASFLNF